jgi:hypothetical protein
MVAAGEGVWYEGVGFVAVAFWLPAGLGLRFARRARVEVMPDGLVVVTTFSEHRFLWSEIRSAVAGYAGIAICLRDGRTFLAGAVQKGNYAGWLRLRTRADELADLIVSRSAPPSA